MKFNKLLAAVMNSQKKDWYKMQVNADVADIYIYDEISWLGVDAQQFVKDLNQITAATINLHLHSPGGNLFDGIAIYNALKQHKSSVDVYIEGLAASSASIIALAGDKIYMAKNAFYMIHNPFICCCGNSDELRKMADTLDKFTGTMIQTYVTASGQSEKQIKDWLDAETWMTADEAKANGFIHEIIEEIEAKASYDLSVYDNVPQSLLESFAANSKQQEPETKPDNKQLETMRMRLMLEDTDESVTAEADA